MAVKAGRCICWPNPDATCLSGGCSYCDAHPFVAGETIARYAREASILPHRAQGEEDAYQAFVYGQHMRGR